MKKFIKYYLGNAPGALLGYIILLFYAPKDPKNLEETFLLAKSIAIGFIAKESINFIILKWCIFKKSPKKEIRKEIFLYFFTMLLVLVPNALACSALTVWLDTIKFTVMGFNINSLLSQGIMSIFFLYLIYPVTKRIFNFNSNGKKLGNT